MITSQTWECAPSPAGRTCSIIRRSSHFELWVHPGDDETGGDLLGAENPSAEGTDAGELEQLARARGAADVVHWYAREVPR